MNLRLLLCLSLFATAAYAGPRTSPNNVYTILTDVVDAGGLRASSTNYTNDASAGSVVGISSVASPAETAKDGYIGQLTELSTFVVNATPSSIPQATTSQLSGTATFDDGTTSALSGSNISWNSAAYPFQSISNAGLLTAVANVYSNPAGTVTGSYLGSNSMTSVTVTGPYNSSGIPDSWFTQYFGAAPNSQADPSADADGTGQNNLFKYIAGLNPLDGSRFVLKIASQFSPNQKNVIFNPINAGSSYAVHYKTTLSAATWTPLTGTTQSDNGSTRTVNDAGATAPKFYEVQISKP